MMKRAPGSSGYAPTASLLLLLALACAMPVGGQTLDSRSFDTEVRRQSSVRGANTPLQSSDWVRIAPVGEEFTVLMPSRPRLSPDVADTVSFDQAVRFYGSSDGDSMYTVSSSPKAGGASPEAMLNPLTGEYEHPVFKDLRRRGYWTKVIEKRDLALKGYKGREYQLSLGNETSSLTRVYVTHRRIYTLIWIYNHAPGAAGQTGQERFLSSFSLGTVNSDASASNVYTGDEQTYPMDGRAIGPACGGAGCAGTGQGGYAGTVGGGGSGIGLSVNDPNRVFSVREVTQRARITSKPEPEYTALARQHNVNGTVVLRVVLAANGEVRNIRAVSGLPYGLTEKAIAAVRRLRFIPAQKDGRPVSQSILIEYNFNTY